MNEKIYDLIQQYVSQYRRQHELLKETTNPKTQTVYFILKYEAYGAIQALYHIDPKNPAWKETKWCNY